MVHALSSATQKVVHRRNENQGGTPDPAKAPRPAPTDATQDDVVVKARPDVAGLRDYRMGDCLGKGAFGAVYRALNPGTGETVAVKQIKLADLPKSELRVIMIEIDLLKNLNHPNIVKYHGFVKSAESLNIILEFCENGSLHSICKNFGKFPENLVALYIVQVLHGLLYLHEQGVIHRDIKGANILTTKEGLVKLADFGVATKASGLSESSVVGTPYWMAPEVIELSGATTASDIWSLGCTVIELLDGKPPYHKLQPMPALFRIVNDDHPPLPESASPAVQDFLMQCFQKDPNLRVSAKKLLKHPWIMSARRADAVVPTKPTKYDEAVKSVQQWNEALKSPDGSTIRRHSRNSSTSPVPTRAGRTARLNGSALPRTGLDVMKPHTNTQVFRSPELAQNDNWDDDFASSINSSALQLPHLRPVDNFAGMLSADKLKAYATMSSDSLDISTDDDCDTTQSLRKDEEYAKRDPLETVRPRSPSRNNLLLSRQERPWKALRRTSSQPKTQILRTPLKATPELRPAPPKRSSSMFQENPIEDYSDLITEDGVALDQKFNQVLKARRKPRHAQDLDSNMMQSKQGAVGSPKFAHVSDIRNGSRVQKSPKGSGSLRQDGSPTIGKDSVDMRRTKSSVEIQKYAEKVEDEDFSDIFAHDSTVLAKQDSESGSERGMRSMLNSKLSNASWPEDEEDEDDPFAQLEGTLNEMDMETKVARDKHVRLGALVETLIGSLKVTQMDDVLADISEQLLQVLSDSPDMKTVVISSHGLLPILEVLENCQYRDISLRLLKIINIIILDSVEIQENFCFVGGIPVVTKFAHKKHPRDIRLEAAAFVRQMYQASTLTLQMFISCGGLNVLVEFLEEDYEAERDLVLIGVNGVWSVFELQGPTPKNDFCRIFSRSSVLYPLSLVLNRVLEERGELAELVEGRIVNIFFLFSQAENHVKESVADRMVLKRVLKDLKRMSPSHQITMLKFIKNLSMLATTLDSMQNSNAIEVLTDFLSSSTKLPHFREISNQILNIMFNLCRLSKPRQEDAALNGIIPLLQRIVNTDRPLKEFALPILCDMAHSGKVGRKILWQNKGLAFYIGLLADPYWQVTALDAIFIWLQEETAKVEEYLLEGSFSRAIVNCFTNSKADAFENLLEPLQKLLRVSPAVAATLAQPELFARTAQKLLNKKAVVRGNLLRIIKSVCDASEEQDTLIIKYGLYPSIERLAENDPAILVRNMAADLINSNMRGTVDGNRYRQNRRTSSFNATVPLVYQSSPQPPTPQDPRTIGSPSYHAVSNDYSMARVRPIHLAAKVTRPTSRKDEVPPHSSASGVALSGKARAPRTNSVTSLLARSTIASKREENIPPTPTAAGASRPHPPPVTNPRRRRQLSNVPS